MKKKVFINIIWVFLTILLCNTNVLAKEINIIKDNNFKKTILIWENWEMLIQMMME